MSLQLLVSPSNLRNALKVPNNFYKNYRIIEASVGQAAKPHFDNGHIDKAVYLDTTHCSSPSAMHPRAIPNKQCFEDYVGSLGISNKHHLVLYDRSPFGFYASSRMWWIFRLFGHEKISILNGGFQQWSAQNYELSKEVADFKPEKFQIKNERKDLLRSYEDIKENVQSLSEQVIDARSSEDFNQVDPATGQPNNRIPFSKNVPYSYLFDRANGGLKDRNSLFIVFKEQGINFDKPLVASCLTGMTACTLALAAYVLDEKNVPVYSGSWTEYSQKWSKD